jgi:FMN phosphatase YigB (HAD superfamily)
MNIILDYNRTLFNPDTNNLYEGVIELLETISKDNELSLVSKNELGRSDRLEKLGIQHYFKNIAFVDKKSAELFTELTGGNKNALVIGDRVREEVAIGNSLGLTTIWVQQGKFAAEFPAQPSEQPTHTVKDIASLQQLLASLSLS